MQEFLTESEEDIGNSPLVDLKVSLSARNIGRRCTRKYPILFAGYAAQQIGGDHGQGPEKRQLCGRLQDGGAGGGRQSG